MGQVVRMYPRLTMSNLTEGLRNVFTKKSSKGGYTPINSYAIQWTIDVNYIKRVKIVANGAGSISAFNLDLEEKYYNKNETFALENQTQLFVIAPPVRISSGVWRHQVKPIAGVAPDDAFMKKGRTTKFRSNY
ncbi:MAG: hypothetical protein DRI46_14395, partial [Chloroflexi bacterium]